MYTEALVKQIDMQIAKLQTARAALLALNSPLLKGKRGRPKGSKEKKSPTKKRKLSAEARSKIADAQKRRWAAARNAK